VCDARNNKKNRIYLTDEKANSFSPFVMTTCGVFSKPAVALISRLAAEAEIESRFTEKAFFQMAIARLIVALHKGNARLSQLGLIRMRLNVARIEADSDKKECKMCFESKEDVQFDYVLTGCVCIDKEFCFECMFTTVTQVVSSCFICGQERTHISVQPGEPKNVLMEIEPRKAQGDDEAASLDRIARMALDV